MTNDLVWENKQGNLFWLSGSLDQATMEKIAGSVAEVKSEPLPEYALTILPAGASLFSRSTLPEVVKEQWSVEGSGGFSWTYSTLPLHAGGTGTVETVKVNGSEARFWQEKTQVLTVVAKTGDSETSATLGGSTCSSLLWTDPETKINFLLQGHLDRDVLIFMAEHVGVKNAEAGK